LDETSFLAATVTHPTPLVTGIVDLEAGRLIDVLPARSARAVTDWLGSKPARWRGGIRHVVIDPYQLSSPGTRTTFWLRFLHDMG
jgi:Transposase